MKKISDLQSLTTSADTDLIEVVDISEPELVDRNKKQTKENLLKEVNARVDATETDIATLEGRLDGEVAEHIADTTNPHEVGMSQLSDFDADNNKIINVATPTDDDDAVNKEYALTLAVPIGSLFPFAGSSAPTGYLICNGDAVSRATYADLFTLISDTYGAGNGSTTFNLPDLRSRLPIGAGSAPTKVATFVSRSSNIITVSGISNATNNEFQTGQAVLYTAASGAMTGLTHNTTYYLIRTGNLTFSLATTLANAQNGTVITLSSDGTGTQTFTLTLTARTLGTTGGEENHAMTTTELVAHSHPANYQGSSQALNAGATGTDTRSPGSTGSTGGNAAMNNMQPFLALNYIIKT